MTETAFSWRSGVHALADKVQDEKLLRRVWKILDRQYQKEASEEQKEKMSA